eukprot:CAMPEP_0183328578 /NCGR_PEP_ID=MMETSP0160_2-20130417/84354_1 /TAXON_ID=2839 ORGANISM="Odontella Sinensis, Strain Grunow 1884" /NCGR_SAMPLE_ID=MMETSP0160_2 /ASSEMBLY_ACC=CAM_ASM_000250 /LENGTH=55 /DNA_ID=CAMNT_0025496741 /DNA_START=528 /DNA_END=698 /DNA_ORIENTATION=+
MTLTSGQRRPSSPHPMRGMHSSRTPFATQWSRIQTQEARTSSSRGLFQYLALVTK